MNTDDLVEELSNLTGFTKVDTKIFLDGYKEVVYKFLNRGQPVNMSGFGSFRVTRRKARKGVHPKTREPLRISAKNVPQFKPGKIMKECVN